MFEPDEYIFTKLAYYFKRKKKEKKEALTHLVKLDDIKPRLTILSRALTGEAIDLFPAQKEGGFKQLNFFLPNSFSLLPSWEENLAFYWYRVLYLSIQKQLKINWYDHQEHPVDQSRQKAKEEGHQILNLMFKTYPPSEHLYQNIKSKLDQLETKDNNFDYWLYGKLMYDPPLTQANDRLNQFDDTTQQAEKKDPQTIIKANAVEEIVSVQVDKKQQEDAVLQHQFEKVETADEFHGNWRDMDGDDELEDHANALDDINMKFTVRVDDPTHSVYQADFIENTTIKESAEHGSKGYFISYDEWDYRKKNYKSQFCKLYPKTILKSDTNYYNNTLKEHKSTLNNLRKMLTSVNNKYQQVRRQVQGEDIDIDAITDLFVDVHTGHTPSEKIYLSKRKKEKDLSILLLLDTSLSSDGYAADNRVIDVEKQVSILFGEILDEFQIDFAIDSFYSKTRNHSSYVTIKDFDQPWQKAKHCVGAVEPNGYTRIGTALRHANAILKQRPTKNKWVILLSDGKPNDYDKYEGKYGIQDVKQAIRELNQNQINSYALAIEAQAKYYLPQMFGQNHYQILTNPTELLHSLVQLYEKIKYQK